MHWSHQITPFLSTLRKRRGRFFAKRGEGGATPWIAFLNAKRPFPQEEKNEGAGELPSSGPLAGEKGRSSPLLHLHHRRPLNGAGGSRPAVRSPRHSRFFCCCRRRRPPRFSALPFQPLTLDFAEGAHAQRVPQDVMPDLHPPVLMFLFIRRRHLAPKTEPAHQSRAWTVFPPPPLPSRSCTVKEAGGRGSSRRRGKETRSLKRPPDSESRKPTPSPNYGIVWVFFIIILPLLQRRAQRFLLSRPHLVGAA